MERTAKALHQLQRGVASLCRSPQMHQGIQRRHRLRLLPQVANPRASSQDKMSGTLTIQGIGEGSQKCAWEISTPIAVAYSDGAVRKHKITSPIVEGSGADLPGLLGLRFLEHERSIIDTGNLMLHFLGKGEAQIILPPGSSAIPLQKAPSGLLVMEIDVYEKVRPYKGGLPDTSLQLHATDEEATPEASMIRSPITAPPPSKRSTAALTSLMLVVTLSSRPAAFEIMVEGQAAAELPGPAKRPTPAEHPTLLSTRLLQPCRMRQAGSSISVARA